MAEIEPAHDAARGEPDGVALRTSEPAPPLLATGETDPEPSADLLDRDGKPEEPDDEDRGSAGRRFIGSTPFLIFVALAVAILVKTFVIQAFYIPSESMVPTLEVGDRVFVSKFMFDGGDVARGDVIVFENPNAAELPDRSGISSVLHWLGEGVGLAQPENEDFIKRVIALPGRDDRDPPRRRLHRRGTARRAVPDPGGEGRDRRLPAAHRPRRRALRDG